MIRLRFTYGRDRGIERCVFRRKGLRWVCHVLFIEEVSSTGEGRTKTEARENARKKVLTRNLRAFLYGHGSTSIADAVDSDAHDAINGVSGHRSRAQRTVSRTG